jgi:hypothetical protein
MAHPHVTPALHLEDDEEAAPHPRLPPYWGPQTAAVWRNGLYLDVGMDEDIDE